MKTKLCILIASLLVLSGCGGDNVEQQVTQCIRRNNNLETVVALDLCQGAYNQASNGNGIGFDDLFLAYMIFGGRSAWSYPLIGSPFTPYGRYSYVSPTNTTIVNNYGGIAAQPAKVAKTNPLKSPKAGTKAPSAKPPTTTPAKPNTTPAAKPNSTPAPKAAPAPKAPTTPKPPAAKPSSSSSSSKKK